MCQKNINYIANCWLDKTICGFRFTIYDLKNKKDIYDL